MLVALHRRATHPQNLHLEVTIPGKTCRTARSNNSQTGTGNRLTTCPPDLSDISLADMYTANSDCQSYVYDVDRADDRGKSIRKDAAGCLLFAAEQATQVALQAVQTLGGTGYINETSPGRLLRDAKLYEIGAGTSEIRRMLIGRELFRESQ